MLVFRMQEFGEVSSTNDVVKRALDAGEPEGLAVLACCQSGGYGRQGRTWASPEGGLYLSLLLRPQVPPTQLPTLSLTTALAVREAVVSYVGGEFPVDASDEPVVRAGGGSVANADANVAAVSTTRMLADSILIKWPNDLVVPEACQLPEPLDVAKSCANQEGQTQSATRADYCKLCGISLEAHGGGVCVGIGVNVAHPGEFCDVGGKNQPAYLADLTGWDRAEALEAISPLAQAILNRFALRYASWCEQGFVPLQAAYEAHAALRDKPVRIADQTGGILCEGVARGIDSHGCLLVEDEKGATTPLSSGEVHVFAW